MEKKMTYVEALNVVLNGGEVTEEVAEKLTALKKSLEKKSANKKPTKAQVENEKYIGEILTVLETIEKGTASEIAKASDVLKDFSNQKVTSLLKILCEREMVERFTEGRKAIFKLKVTDVDAE